MKHTTTQTIGRVLCILVLLAGITEKVRAINSYYWVSRDWTSGAVYGAYWSYGNSWSASSGGSGLGGSGLTVGGVQSYLNFDGSAAAPANGLYNNTNDFNNASGFQIYFKSTIPAAYNLYGNPITFYDISGTDPNIQNEGTTYTPTINFAITNGNLNGTFRILNLNLNASPARGPLIFNGPIYGGAADANARVINIGGGNLTFNNTIANGAGGGTLALTLLGSGTVTLAATNTFTGDLSINAGTVVLATNSAVSASGAIRLGDVSGSTGANLNLNGGNTVSALINARATTGGKIIANTSGTAGAATFTGNLFLDGDATLYANTGGGNVLSGGTLDLKNQTLTLSGAGTNLISGSLQQSTGSGKLVISAANTATLAGNNSYAGGTTLNSGALLNLNSATALGTGALTLSGSATSDNTSGSAITLANNNALTLSGGSLTFSGSADLNFGTGLVTLSGANRTLTVSAGNLTFGGGVTDGGGALKLTKAGSGTLILNGAAGTWTGGFSASAGTVNLGNNTALGTGLFTLGGITLVAGGGARTIANPVLWSVSATIGGTNSLTFNGGFTNSAASHTLTVNNTNTVTLAGPVYLADDNVNARTVTLTNSGPVVISGPIANNNLGNTTASTLQLNGTNTTTLAGTNTFTGQLTVQSGGSVSVSSLSNALGTVSAIQLGGGGANGTLLYTGPGETSTRIILFAATSAGSGQVIDQSGSGLLNFTNAFAATGSTSFTLTLQGSTSGSGQISSVLSNNAAGTARSLVKAGTGTWTLAGANTYTGPTTVNAGTLVLTGSLGTNSLTVNAVLNGTGTVNGPTTVNFGGTLQAGLGGSDTSALVISNRLTLAGKAVFNLNRTNISTPTANKISGLTNVIYGGTLTVTNVGPALQASDTFTLFQSSAYAGGFTNIVLPTLNSGLGWNTNNLAVNGTISVISLIGVTVSPATTNVTYGTSATLTANVTGAGPFTYQWYDNHTNAIAGQTNSTLTIAPAVAASGNYTVVASNLSGTATNNGTLTVNALAVVLSGTRAYDGTTAAASGILSVANKIGADDVTVASGSATLAGATVATQGITSFGSLALGGTTAGNYTFTGASGAVVITAASTSTAVVSSSNPIGYLGALTFTANVSPTNASGSVTFSANGTPFSTNTLVAGVAVSGGISSLARGTNTITAAYGGDANYSGSSGGLSQVVTNHPPVAGNVSYTVVAGVVSLQVAVSNLLASVTDADGDSITLVSLGNSTNGITPVIAGSLVQYYNTNGVSDQFSYTVSDGFGGTNTASVSIVVSNSAVGQVTGAFTSFTGGVANLTFHGIPDLSYVAERSTNLADWVDVVTNTAATNGVISVQDYFNDLGGTPPASAYYRLKWQP